ncbi:MAG: hypothetical protein KKB51_17285 [Candidatus Riflebacteria bacterium]|nr:hypothetical protein [Candidatus Riflebacteria bacterium]
MFKKSLLLMILFVGLAGQLLAQSHEFILYAFPPATPLNWSSPLKLAYGAGLKGRLVFEHGKNKHTIGHAFMELRKDGKRVELTGSTTAPDAPSDADFITKRGYGLGVLFAPMKGALDKSDKLDGELIERYKTGKVMFIRFIINEQAYNRMKQYIDEYRAKGYDTTYNGTNEPRKGKGAGCSAFAMSFLDVCGYIDPQFTQAWIRRVNLPKSLVGGPITGNHVSLAKTLFRAHWAKPGEDAILLEMWDPQMMFEWLQNTHKKAFQMYKEQGNYKSMKVLGKNFRFDQRGRATGLIIDISDLSPTKDPIWQD